MPCIKELASDTVNFSRRVIREVKAQVKAYSSLRWTTSSKDHLGGHCPAHNRLKVLQRAKSWAFESQISRMSQKSFRSRPRWVTQPGNSIFFFILTRGHFFFKFVIYVLFKSTAKFYHFTRRKQGIKVSLTLLSDYWQAAGHWSLLRWHSLFTRVLNFKHTLKLWTRLWAIIHNYKSGLAPVCLISRSGWLGGLWRSQTRLKFCRLQVCIPAKP